VITSLNQVKNTDFLVLVSRDKLFIADADKWSPVLFSNIDKNLIHSQTVLWVGEYKEQNCYAIDIASEENDDKLFGLRSQIDYLDENEFLLAGRALQLHRWFKQHQYCGQCGRPTQNHPQESALYCQPCELTYYPRISPCIICLVVKGEECLLARHDRHPEGLYSTLAGFVEAGENLEQTLHREIMEEVGIKVKNIQYFSSQAWPFPNQLMVGFFVEYDSGEIKVDDVEIKDAKWFHYSNLPKTPPTFSISGQLIKTFINSFN
jgi:NAD+ diphosphatase